MQSRLKKKKAIVIPLPAVKYYHPQITYTSTITKCWGNSIQFNFICVALNYFHLRLRERSHHLSATPKSLSPVDGDTKNTVGAKICILFSSIQCMCKFLLT